MTKLVGVLVGELSRPLVVPKADSIFLPALLLSLLGGLDISAQCARNGATVGIRKTHFRHLGSRRAMVALVGTQTAAKGSVPAALEVSAWLCSRLWQSKHGAGSILPRDGTAGNGSSFIRTRRWRGVVISG
jgi:hypothetical protein